MRLVLLAIVAPLAFAAQLAAADTVYKCVEGGKTTYTSNPCGKAPAKELVYAAPTAEERRTADAKRQLAQQELDNSLAQRRADENAYYQARQEAAERRATDEASSPPVDPRANEKIMVHTPSGWDYKTRAQISAEAEAKSARRARRPATPPPTLTDQTGKVWQNHGGTAFDQNTGRRCVVAGNALVNCH